jgi:hypothetical protein
MKSLRWNLRFLRDLRYEPIASEADRIQWNWLDANNCQERDGSALGVSIRSAIWLVNDIRRDVPGELRP